MIHSEPFALLYTVPPPKPPTTNIFEPKTALLI